MSRKNLEFSLKVQQLARQTVIESGYDVMSLDAAISTPLIKFAKPVMAKTGCSVDTAKKYVAQAIRRLRGEEIAEKAQGGVRVGAGRPKKDESEPELVG